ncbi:MAG: hypothetical protein ACO1QB_07595 [Verrucomicrobiales bacterium]
MEVVQDWEEWVKFFLGGVLATAKHAAETAQKFRAITQEGTGWQRNRSFAYKEFLDVLNEDLPN